MQGVIKLGPGSWREVSERFVKTRTPKECEEQYFLSYNISGGGLNDSDLGKRALSGRAAPIFFT